MTKAELIDKIAKDAKVSKAVAANALSSVLEGVSKALSKGDSVTLVGFGTFSVSKRAARKGRNPQTGGEIRIAAAKVPRFRAGKNLKDMVNRK
jgi:DNA-binding protein HU-beta